jgi:hypothetical protein
MITRRNKCIRKLFAAIVAYDATIGVKLELYVTEFDVANQALLVSQEAKTQAFRSHSQAFRRPLFSSALL